MVDKNDQNGESTCKLSKQIDQSVEIAKQSLAVQTKMVHKNDQKFFTFLVQLEKDRGPEMSNLIK